MDFEKFKFLQEPFIFHYERTTLAGVQEAQKTCPV